MQLYTYTIMQVYKYTNIQVHKLPSNILHKYTGKQVHKYTSTSMQVHKSTVKNIYKGNLIYLIIKQYCHQGWWLTINDTRNNYLMYMQKERKHQQISCKSPWTFIPAEAAHSSGQMTGLMWKKSDFHCIGPPGGFSLYVAMSVCLSVCAIGCCFF